MAEKYSTILAMSKDELCKFCTALDIQFDTDSLKTDLQALVLSTLYPSTPTKHESIDLGHKIQSSLVLLPSFDVKRPRQFFNIFEHILTDLQWDRKHWPLLLQQKVVGRAKEIYMSLPVDISMNYDTLKLKILEGLDVNSEFYRQAFRNECKPTSKSFVQFHRDMNERLQSWLDTSECKSFDNLVELILKENFLNHLSYNDKLFLQNANVMDKTSMDMASILDSHELMKKSHVNTEGLHKQNFTHTKHSTNVKHETGEGPTNTHGTPKYSHSHVPVCGYCSRPGHNTESCFTKQRNEKKRVNKKSQR